MLTENQKKLLRDMMFFNTRGRITPKILNEYSLKSDEEIIAEIENFKAVILTRLENQKISIENKIAELSE